MSSNKNLTFSCLLLGKILNACYYHAFLLKNQIFNHNCFLMESNLPINILNAFGKAIFFFSQENNEEIKISIFTTVLIVRCKYKIDKIKNKSLISFVRKLLDKLSFINLMNSFSYENNGLCGQIKLMFNKSLLGIIYFSRLLKVFCFSILFFSLYHRGNVWNLERSTHLPKDKEVIKSSLVFQLHLSNPECNQSIN